MIYNTSIMKTLIFLLTLSTLSNGKYFGISGCRVFVDFIFFDLTSISK